MPQLRLLCTIGRAARRDIPQNPSYEVKPKGHDAIWENQTVAYRLRRQIGSTTQMRVLSMPTKVPNNRYFAFFCDALENAGARVLNIRDADARKFKFDVLHLHFPAHFITETSLPIALVWSAILTTFYFVTKLLGKPIVYSVHDVVPFTAGREWLWKPYLSLVVKLCDAFVFLNETSREEFYTTFANQRPKPNIVVRHGPFPTKLMSVTERAASRYDLAGAEDSFIIGFLGGIKHYKGLEALLELPRQTVGGRPVRVLVAGRVDNYYANTASEIFAALPEDFVIRIDERISDERLDELLQIVDIVLLSYSQGWNSSAAILALSNRARSVCSNLPLFRDLESNVGSSWVRCYDAKGDGKNDLNAVIASFSGRSADVDDSNTLTKFLNDNSFNRGGERMVVFYRTLIDRRPASIRRTHSPAS